MPACTTFSLLPCVDLSGQRVALQGKYVVLFFYPLDFTYVTLQTASRAAALACLAQKLRR